MLLDAPLPPPRLSSVTGSVLLLSLHADPMTTVGAPENGGVTIYVRELARALAAAGWSVDVVTRRASAALRDRETSLGFTVIRIDAGPAEPISNDAIAPFLPQATDAVRALARTRNYRFISSHYWLSGVVGQAIASEFDVPHVHTLHSHGIERKARDPITLERIEVERRLLRDAKIVTLSATHLADFRRKYGVDRTFNVVPAGVDTERFRPGDRDAALATLGLPATRSWIGYVGRISKEKGIDDLVRAMALVHARNQQIGLFVVGGARVRSRIPELTRLAQSLGIKDAVHFLGPIPNDRVAQAFQAADVIAVPSHYEAFGLVALEARATGTPVVASDVGGLRALVGPQVGGARVPVGDLHAWAQALEDALEPHELARRKALAREQNGNDVYAWDRIARTIADIAMNGAHV